MALTDHVAILLGHSLNVARLNKKKTRSDFYAQVALPPAAVMDIAALVAEVYPGVPLNSLEVNCQTNAQQSKPFAGVPADWYIVRLASAFAPELYAADGVTPIPVDQARTHFFSGQRVRVHSTAWGWKNEFGKSGASFNLHGVMDAGQGGERLAIGNGGQAGAAFKAHGNPNATPTGGANNPNGNPFAGATTQGNQSAGAGAATAANSTGSVAAAAPAGQTGNPFATGSGAGAQSGNPFAQQAANTGNPFAA